MAFAQLSAILEPYNFQRRIIGFDLNEVAPNPTDDRDQWDGNVGARMLYKLIAFTLASQRRAALLD